MQQIPCAQKPELQSASAEQPAPIGFLPQLPFRQLFPLVQSALPVQLVLHAAPDPHTYGTHDWAGVAWQVPLPSQRPANVNDEPLHPALEQMTLVTYFSQAPAPSQLPSVPHVAAPVSVQSCRGSVPTSAGMQVPTWPTAAQVWQIPEQSIAQQKPSAQKPDRQSDAVVQAWPVGSVPVAPPRSTAASALPPDPPVLVARMSLLPPSAGGLPRRAAAPGEARAGAERGDREHRPRSGPPSSRHHTCLGGGVRPGRIRVSGAAAARPGSLDLGRRLRARHDPRDVGIFADVARRPVGLSALALITALGLLFLLVLACQFFLALLEGVRPRSHGGPNCAPGQRISHLQTVERTPIVEPRRPRLVTSDRAR